MTIADARALVAQNLGLANFDGSRAAYSALSAPDQERVSVETIRYIISNPDRFTSEQVQAAQLQAGKQNFGSLGNYTNPDLLDNATEFLQAYAETAGNVVVGAADVAGRSVKKLGINLGALVTIVAVGALLYFGAPYVLPKLAQAFKKKPAPPSA